MLGSRADPACAGMWEAWNRLPRPQRLRIGGCVSYVALLIGLFLQPLTSLMLYAASSELHSHILLVPFITAWLLYLQRGRCPAPSHGSIAGTIALGGIGMVALTAYMALRGNLSVNDELALMAFAFVGFAAAGGFLFLGSTWMASAAFPVAFLIFMVPLPDAAVRWVERVLVFASAEIAALFFSVTGTPFGRDGTTFELPGIVLSVARECSGIHSTWVLFITSLLASHLFIKSGWRRIVLVAFVIPLGIIRNGFRILTIGLLCVHIGPNMIDSPVHHRGGPLFFALSLVPLFLLLWWLRRREHRAEPAG